MPERERVRVTACGELDLANAERLAIELCELLDSGWVDVALDLRHLAFIDSSGIHALVSCDRHARQAGRRVSIVVSSGPIARAIDLCGVRGVLNVVPA